MQYFVTCVYNVSEAVQAVKVSTVVASVAVVRVLTRCSLFHTVCDLKTVPMNVQYYLIREFALCDFGLGHDAAEATKNICFMKEADAVDHSTVIRWFKKFNSRYKNLGYHARSCWPTSLDFTAVLRENSANSIERVSGELGISQSGVVRHLHDFCKSIRRCWIVSHVLLKYWKTFDSPKSFWMYKFVSEN